MIKIVNGIHELVADVVCTLEEGNKFEPPKVNISDRILYSTGVPKGLETVDMKRGVVDLIEFFSDGSHLVYVKGDNMPITPSDFTLLGSAERLTDRYSGDQRIDLRIKTGDVVTGAIFLVQGSSNPDIVYFTDPQVTRIFKAIMPSATEAQNLLGQPSPYGDDTINQPSREVQSIPGPYSG